MITTKEWKTVAHPRRWRVNMRVIGFTHPNGRDYAQRRVPLCTYDERISQTESGSTLIKQGKSFGGWRTIAKQHHGVLVKNEYCVVSTGYAIVFPRYTVKCDDGRTRKFQYIQAE